LRFVAGRPPPRLHLGTAKAIDENFSDFMRNSGGSALYAPQSFSSLMRITAALARLDLADSITFAHYVDARQLLESCADDAAATGSDATFSDLRRGGPSRVGDIRMQRMVFLKAMIAHCEQEGKFVRTLKECWDMATRRGIGCAADEFKTLILEPLMAVNNQKIMVRTADTEKYDDGRERRIIVHVRCVAELCDDSARPRAAHTNSIPICSDFARRTFSSSLSHASKRIEKMKGLRCCDVAKRATEQEFHSLPSKRKNEKRNSGAQMETACSLLRERARSLRLDVCRLHLLFLREARAG
jgi:hypothetical protein